MNTVVIGAVPALCENAPHVRPPVKSPGALDAFW